MTTCRPVCQEVAAHLVRGYGVASGEGRDPRYPRGTLALQLPHFEARGLSLARYRRGTLNLCIAPYVPVWSTPLATLRGVAWSPHVPPEDFSFYACGVRRPGRAAHDALVYRPHPETKPEHEQPADVLEVLAPDLGELEAAALLYLRSDPASLRFRRTLG